MQLKLNACLLHSDKNQVLSQKNPMLLCPEIE